VCSSGTCIGILDSGPCFGQLWILAPRHVAERQRRGRKTVPHGTVPGFEPLAGHRVSFGLVLAGHASLSRSRFSCSPKYLSSRSPP
jgi:hypothetical protein